MSKSLSLAKSSARGGFNVFWGLIISSIISAVGIIVIADLLTGEEFGVVTIVFMGPNLIATIRDLGIDQATIKYATQYRIDRDTENLKSIVVTGTLFEIILGVLFTVFSIVLSGFMADILGRPTIVDLIKIASFTILAGALLKIAQSSFIGYEKMKIYSLTLVLQSLFKTVLMILLIHLQFGVYGAVVGNAVSFVGVGIVSIAVLYIVVIQKLERQKETSFQLISTLKRMLKFGFPLSISTTLFGILSNFYSFFVAIYTTDLIFGNYQVAINFGILISIFASPIATMMFPTFSKVKGNEDQKTLSSVFQYSVKYTSLLIVPVTLAVITLSQPIVETIFQNKYVYAPFFLSFYAITYLYSAIGNLSADALISSQGKTQFNLKIAIITFIVGIIFSILLIPVFGVLGLLVVHNIVSLPGILISLWWINKHYGATIDWKSTIKILAASAFSGVLTYIIGYQLKFAGLITLFVSAAIFLFSYIISAPLIGAINYNDTQNLKEMVKGLGPLTPVINLLIYPLEKITRYKQSK